MAIELTDDELTDTLATLDSARFAGQDHASDAGISACAKLVAEARSRGLDTARYPSLAELLADPVTVAASAPRG